MASASFDQTVKIWSVETGQQLHVLPHDGPVADCTVTHDGSFLMTVSGNTVLTWDPRSGTELRRLQPIDGASISSLAASRDGSLLVGVVTYRADPNRSSVAVWDLDTGRSLQDLQLKEGIFSCTIAPDASFVVTASGPPSTGPGQLIVWDLAKGRPLHKLKGSKGRVLDCAVAPDRSFIASAGEDGLVRTWDAATGRELRRMGSPRESKYVFRDPERVAKVCAVSPDGSWIVAGYADNTVKLWNTETGEELRTLEGCEDEVTAVAFAEDASFFVTGDMQGDIRIWSLDVGREIHAAEGHQRSISECVFAPDGSFIVSASEDHTLKVWTADAERVLRTLEGHQAEVRTCAVFPDSSVIASAGDDGTIILWNSQTGDLVRIMQPPVLTDDPLGAMRRVNTIDVSPDASFVVSSQGFSLSVWDPRQGHEVIGFERHGPLGGHGHIRECAVSPDASYVASANDDGLWLWDPATGAEIRTLSREGARDCAIAPDGSFIVSDADLWNPASGAHLRIIEGSSAPCAVAPDGRYVVTGGDAVRIAEASSGRLVAMIPIVGWIASVDFHPSKYLIVVGDSTGTVNLIELMNMDLGPLIVTARRDEDILRFRCPSCVAVFRIPEGLLGRAFDCKKCGRALWFNSFVLDRSRWASKLG